MVKKNHIQDQDNVVDYQKFCPIDTPVYRRREWDVGDIYSNQIKCRVCGDHIRSKNRHHFVTCSCGAVSIDGGSWYSRISGHYEDYELETVYYDEISE